MNPSFHLILELEHERTILDYFNDDCWHAVLNYLSVKEILQTERTSKHWQRVMLAYLSRIKIHIDEWSFDNHTKRNYLLMRSCYDGLVFERYYSSFKLWSYKLGAAVVSYRGYYYYRYHYDDDDFKVLGKNFPNLEKIYLRSVMNQIPPNPNSTEEYFPCLKQICLDCCKNVTDDCISQFLGSTVLEELKMLSNVQITGQFLLNLKSAKLKSLVLRSCRALKLPPLLTVAERISGLTKLVLTRACDEIRDNVHLIIDKLPKLEFLTILINTRISLQSNNIFFESVCRLKHLRHLNANFRAWDQHLEKITECCKELEVLKLLCFNVTGRGTAAVRSLGTRLTQLDLIYSSVTDDDLLALVCACPNLTWLRLTGCERLHNAVPRVAAARREQRASTRLHMNIDQCDLEDFEDEDVEDVLTIRYSEDDVEDSY